MSHNHFKTQLKKLLCILSALLILVSFCSCGINAFKEAYGVSNTSPTSFKDLFKHSFVDDNRAMKMLNGTGVTVVCSIVSLVFGAILGYAFYVWSYLHNRFFTIFRKLRGLYSLLPPSAWLAICYYLIFGGTHAMAFPAAIFALAIDFAAQTYDNFYLALDTINKGELEAALSIGFTRKQILNHFVIPQSLPLVLSEGSEDAKVHIRATSLIGMISLMDITSVTDGILAQTLEPLLPVIVSALVYMALSHIFSKAILIIKNRLPLGQKSEAEIVDNILRGHI